MAPGVFLRRDGSGRLTEPYDCVRRPTRETAVKIRTDIAHGQDTSLLFALPAEIRTLIFEYVIGSGVVHIRERHCEKHDNWTAIKRYKEFTASTAEHRRNYGFVDIATKLTYSTCQTPREWNARYALSQRPTDMTEEPLDGTLPSVVPPGLEVYTRKHTRCIQSALRDFQNGDYKDGCCALHPETLKTSGCKACQARYNRWTATFGQAPHGLKSFHAKSGIDLSLLLSCRQAYKEAWHLPYLQYTFDFPAHFREIMEVFAQRVLYSHQRALIHTFHLNDWPRAPYGSTKPERLPFHLFPGLRALRISYLSEHIWDFDLVDYEELIGSGQLTSAEVINGFDEDYTVRAERRRVAGWIEGVLLGK